jgi:hypothetical protein
LNIQQIKPIKKGDIMAEKKLALVVQSGTIDKLYCAFILASTAVALGGEKQNESKKENCFDSAKWNHR